MHILLPASSKWPFDHPNGGHLTLEKVTNKTPKKATRKNLVENSNFQPAHVS